MDVCIITDNNYLFENFKKLISERNVGDDFFRFYYSFSNKTFIEKYKDSIDFSPICLKEKNEQFFSQYDLYISLHCKQLFPESLVKKHRCINIHPGFNPYNRGWFPQVFSILNKEPIGVTIHEMDEKLDHGSIIFQEELSIFSYDTSYDIYKRILSKEIEMLEKHLDNLLSGDYTARSVCSEGNINFKSDFDRLCHLDLEQQGSFGSFIDILRATTFEGYDNAFFYDEYGNKIYITINLKRDN